MRVWLDYFPKILFILMFLASLYDLIFLSQGHWVEWYAPISLGILVAIGIYLNKKNPISKIDFDKDFFIALALFFLALVIFYPQLYLNSVWLDEDNQVLKAYVHVFERNDSVIRGAAHDTQVPLSYYITFWTIKIFGLTEFGVRAQAIFFSAIAAACIYSLIRRLAVNVWIAASSSIIFILSPYVVFFSSEGRPYAASMVYMLFFLNAVVLFLKKSDFKNKLFLYANALSYFLIIGLQPVAIIGLVSIYVALSFVFLQKIKQVAGYIVCIGLASVSFIPFAYYVIHEWSGINQEQYSQLEGSRIDYLIGRWNAHELISLYKLFHPYTNFMLIIFVAGLVLALFSHIFKSKRVTTERGLFYFLAPLTPLSLAIVFFSVTDVYLARRYGIPFLPIMTVALGLALSEFKYFFTKIFEHKKLSLALVLLFFAWPMYLFYEEEKIYNRRVRMDWRALYNHFESFPCQADALQFILKPYSDWYPNRFISKDIYYREGRRPVRLYDELFSYTEREQPAVNMNHILFHEPPSGECLTLVQSGWSRPRGVILTEDRLKGLDFIESYNVAGFQILKMTTEDLEKKMYALFERIYSAPYAESVRYKALEFFLIYYFEKGDIESFNLRFEEYRAMPEVLDGRAHNKDRVFGYRDVLNKGFNGGH